uniref:Uncharacterized protein n=1 Tax=Rhizophora mucronata TaxID=61149 RepID=A0A2P2PL49_RHIMU
METTFVYMKFTQNESILMLHCCVHAESTQGNSFKY